MMGIQTRKRELRGAGLVLLTCWFLGGCGSGETARLEEAVYAGDPEAIAAAVKAGADVNGLNEEDMPFLLYALLAEDVQATRALLENGADSDIASYEASGLVVAAGLSDDLTFAVLDAGGTWRPGEEPALLAEAASWAPAAVERLLDLGIDPNSKVEGGLHPLVIVSEQGSLAGYRALKNAGAVAPEAEVFEAALSSGQQDLFAAVVADSPDAPMPEPWFSQVVEMDSETLDRQWLEQLVERYGAPDSSELNSALSSLAYEVDPAKLGVLIDLGARSPEAKAMTNLIHGLEDARELRGAEKAQLDFEACLTQLVEVGADLNLGEGEEVPLSVAARLLDAGAVEALLEKGADPNGMPSKEQGNPLLAAARSFVKTLVELDDPEEDGEQVASSANQVVSVLLSAGADPNVVTKEGTSLLHFAAAGASADMARSLLDVQADASLRNSKGLSAADIARNVLANDPSEEGGFAKFAMKATGLDEYVEARHAGAREILTLLGEPIPEE